MISPLGLNVELTLAFSPHSYMLLDRACNFHSTSGENLKLGQTLEPDMVIIAIDYEVMVIKPPVTFRFIHVFSF